MIRQLPTNNRLPHHHMSYAQSALPCHRHIGSHTASSSTVHLPSQLATSAADVTRATCHPSSGDMCHFRIGPTVRQKVQICLTRVSTWSRHVSCTDLPHVLYGPATCHCMDLPCVLYGLATSASVRTVRTAQSANFCLFDFSDRMRYLLHTDSV
jgi:hypothetical protein